MMHPQFLSAKAAEAFPPIPRQEDLPGRVTPKRSSALAAIVFWSAWTGVQLLKAAAFVAFWYMLNSIY